MLPEFLPPHPARVAERAVLHRGAGGEPPRQAKRRLPRRLDEVGFSFGAGGLPGFGSVAVGVDSACPIRSAIPGPSALIKEPLLISIGWQRAGGSNCLSMGQGCCPFGRGLAQLFSLIILWAVALRI